MIPYSIKYGLAGLIFALVMLLVNAIDGHAQAKLRKAMDFDADGKADVTVFRQSENTWYSNLSGSGNYYTGQFGVLHTDTLAPGDYDGDGKADIAVWRYTNGTFYSIDSSTGALRARAFGTNGDELIQRDYDGDGKTDHAVIRRTGTASSPGAMTWYILRSSDNGFTAMQFGLNTDVAAPGDFDGDGKWDIAVQRAGTATGSQNVFYIYKSSTSSLAVYQWGIKDDQFVPGDYDGDGKTDIAVVRRSSTTTDNLSWYILRSSDLALASANFGTTETDTPIQNDYDGDGKADVAVYRETTGNHYILRSSDSGLTTYQWGYSTDIPVAGYDVH